MGAPNCGTELESRRTAATDDSVQADDRQEPAPTPDLGWVVDVQGEGVRCSICARLFDTYRALNMHEVAVHKKIVCPEAQTNQCPKCLTVFANRSSAKRHFRASRDRPCAVDRGPGNSGTALLQPARHVDRQRQHRHAHAAGRAEQESPDRGSHCEPQEARPHDGELGLPSASVEGATPCFFLPVEGCGLAQAMQAAAAYYDGRSPGKGKPHPDKRRKTTLAGALVKFAAERELQRLTPEEQAALAQTDKLFAAARRPSLAEQHEMLKLIFPLMATPTAMEPEVIACNFWKTGRPRRTPSTC